MAFDAIASRLKSAGANAVQCASGRCCAALACGNETNAHVARHAGLLVAIAGAVRFGESWMREHASSNGSARTVAEAYNRCGPEVFRALLGTFAVAIIDETDGSCALAVDRVGVQALAYGMAGTDFVFATRASWLRDGIGLEIDPQAIYDYAYFHAVAGPRTVYRQLRRLMPGEYAVFQRGALKVERYWQMRFDESRNGDWHELREGLRLALRRGVEHSLDGRPAGAFLSGGTDSSTVAGVLGEVAGEPARTFSIGFDAKGYDEMEYARIAARHFGTRHHEYYVTADDIVAAVPSIAAAHDEPFGNSSAVPAYYCARLARAEGVSVLLAGDGGDELFGGNERYAKQYVFSLYGVVPSWLRSRVIESTLRLSSFSAFPPLRKVRSYVEQASLPMPARLQTYNLVERIGPDRIFDAEFLARVCTNEPMTVLQRAYDGAAAGSMINRMLALDLQITLADSDLPKVTRSCELAGIDVAFPLLDEEIVDFSAHLAPALKLKGTRLRYFFKEALRGFLPDAIIAKKKHGFGLPFGMWLDTNTRLKALAFDSLSDLRRRSIVRSQFLDELTASRVAEHASYYGTMVWVLMMLEQWYKHHVDQGRLVHDE